MVILGVLVSFAVGRMNDSTDIFKEKTMLPLVNAVNPHEARQFTIALMCYNGSFANKAAPAPSEA